MQDLSQLILDLIQNSLAAGSNTVEIYIEINKPQNLLIFNIADNGRGISDEKLDKCTDPFYTTRKTRTVGFGLSFTKMLCEQTEGFFHIESTVNKGTVLEFAFGLKHWDRPPLGSLEETYISLLILNPSLTLNLSFSTEDENFSIKSDDIYQNIEGCEISEGWVVKWLREYLKENFHHLVKEDYYYNE